MNQTILRAAAPALLAGLASAQSLDMSVNQVHVTQAIQTGSTQLVAGKSTMARVPVFLNEALGAGEVVDGILRLYDATGAELPDSPIYSTNGPLALPTSPAPANLDDTLNFIFIAPDLTGVTIEVEVNPAGPGQLGESDYANNTHSEVGVNFVCKRVPECIYVPIDYRPSGGGPNLPDPAMIEPGVGDNFIQGIYPGPDWDYRPADVPSKLWTSSLSGTGSSLLNSLFVDYQALNPKPDFIYGWVPGSLPYNGMAQGIPGKTGIGNTQAIRHQRTFAHELGHLFGLSHNTNDIDQIGVDVEHHLAITESLPVIKIKSKKDIMAAGLLTQQAWVWGSNYNFFLNHSIFQCAAAKAGPSGEERLVVTGLFDHGRDTVELDNLVAFTGTTPTFPEAGIDLQLVAYAGGQEVGRAAVSAPRPVDCSESGALEPIAPFGAVLATSVPASAVDRLEVIDARTGALRTQVTKSASAPVVQVASPTIEEGQLKVSWSASDADGDGLRHFLRYSPNGERVVPVLTGTTETRAALDLDSIPAPAAGAWLEVLSTDGLSTTSVRQPIVLTGAKLLTGAVPTSHILTPDNGLTFQRGATVVLHASGWDLEDRSLTGASVQWTSNLDGPIAQGRVTAVADLSVGTHVLTVTASDSGGQTATDTATVTITDRPLPGAVCQSDLGSGGPGSSQLEVCGGDLSSGTTATASLTGGPAAQPLWLVVGPTSAPTPLFGGTLLPVPAAFLIGGATDGTGSWSLAGIPGGLGPATLFAQVVVIDPAQGQGFGLSNAVQVDFLP